MNFVNTQAGPSPGLRKILTGQRLHSPAKWIPCPRCSLFMFTRQLNGGLRLFPHHWQTDTCPQIRTVLCSEDISKKLCSVWSKDSYPIWFYFQICLTTFYSSRWPRDADWLGFTNRHWDNQSLGVAAFKCKLLAARPRQEISGQTIFRAFSWHKTTTSEKRWLYALFFHFHISDLMC